MSLQRICMIWFIVATGLYDDHCCTEVQSTSWALLNHTRVDWDVPRPTLYHYQLELPSTEDVILTFLGLVMIYTFAIPFIKLIVRFLIICVKFLILWLINFTFWVIYQWFRLIFKILWWILMKTIPKVLFWCLKKLFWFILKAFWAILKFLPKLLWKLFIIGGEIVTTDLE